MAPCGECVQKWMHVLWVCLCMCLCVLVCVLVCMNLHVHVCAHECCLRNPTLPPDNLGLRPILQEQACLPDSDCKRAAKYASHPKMLPFRVFTH